MGVDGLTGLTNYCVNVNFHSFYIGTRKVVDSIVAVSTTLPPRT